MIYPKNYENKIGFDKIRELIKAECSGTIGQDFVDKIRFTDRFDVLSKLLGQADEFYKIIQAGEAFPSNNFSDVSRELQKASIENAFLLEEEIYTLRKSLATVLACLEFFKKQEIGLYPNLTELCVGISVDPQILKEIDKIIDDSGRLRNNASVELQKIRSKIASEEVRLRKQIDQIMKSLKSQGILSEDANLTIREGRAVIPINVEYKRRLKGFIHDTSASGQTVFIEPEEALDINNEIRELEYEERREIVKILTVLTSKIRPFVPELKKAYFFLGLIDFIRAKAKFAFKIEAILPEFQKKSYLKWLNAHHPLLFLNFKEQQKTVVPLNIKLDETDRILLISGPNAGGKSVCLKTVGLVQYMFQCGLLVPVQEGSVFGIFSNIYIDIGDEQSMENDLSTYSSHLKNMKHFLLFADKKTLCLIDEFGTGTEPQFGGTIAEAILEGLNEKQAWGVITTHYTNLKMLAENTKGLTNGAMRFDMQNLEPLFMLDIGKPGSSFALEIAQKIGLPKEIVKNARLKLGTEKLDMEKLLKDLEVEKKSLQEKNIEAEKRQKELAQTLEKYNLLKSEMEINRKELITKAKTEAKELLAKANRKIENTIRSIVESKADKDLTKVLRKDIEDFKEEIDLEIKVEEKKKVKAQTPDIQEVGGQISIGDYVKVKDQDTVAEVVAIRNQDVEIRIGELRSTMKMKRLVKISRKEFRAIEPLKKAASSGMDLNEKLANFTFKLDLRGCRAEEVLPKLQQFLDDAIMLAYDDLQIVHGKGDGVLRTVVRDVLKKRKEVKSMEDEHPDRGGAGVTLVHLR
ncbi:MAG: endonuclease MutS2 [Bacteroidetes bacterium]|nr:MAG: endonuclease MutS2 [Bacteroidota bacterium]